MHTNGRLYALFSGDQASFWCGENGVLFKTSQYAPGLRIRQSVRFVYFCVNSQVGSSIPWRPPQTNNGMEGEMQEPLRRRAVDIEIGHGSWGMQHSRESGHLLSGFMISCQPSSRWSAAASFKRHRYVSPATKPGAFKGLKVPRVCRLHVHQNPLCFPGGNSAHARTKCFASLRKWWNLFKRCN